MDQQEQTESTLIARDENATDVDKMDAEAVDDALIPSQDNTTEKDEPLVESNHENEQKETQKLSESLTVADLEPPRLFSNHNVEPSPGAVRVTANLLDSYEHQDRPMVRHGLEQVSACSRVSAAAASGLQQQQQQQQRPSEPTTLLHAELVVSSSGDNYSRDHHHYDVPYAETAVPIHPWKQWFRLLCLVLAVAGIAVGLAVPLTKDSESSPSLPPTSGITVNPPPSMAPTTTAAPTALEDVTIVIWLDSHPEETGWRLDCNGRNVANFPSGIYDERSANRNRTEQFPIAIGLDCLFTLFVSAGNGLEEGHGFHIYYGRLFSSQQQDNVLAMGGWNFTFEETVDFVMEHPSSKPSPAPIFFEGPPSDLSLAPTSSPKVVTRPPTTLSPTPTTLDLVRITISLQLDEYPSETGWSMTCNGVVLRQIDPRTYAVPNQLVTDVVTARSGDACTFSIVDTKGDGLCCLFQPGGFYRLQVGNDNDDNLIAIGGEFEFSENVTFTVREAV